MYFVALIFCGFAGDDETRVPSSGEQNHGCTQRAMNIASSGTDCFIFKPLCRVHGQVHAGVHVQVEDGSWITIDTATVLLRLYERQAGQTHQTQE